MAIRINPHHFRTDNGYDVLFDTKHNSWAVIDTKKDTYVGHDFPEALAAIAYAKTL